ncbi:MAG TPA: CRISPR-associated protein Cas2 [Thermodesulfobacteriota bacterium]|mgnify:FL=1|nr:CRISPR-associated protein Cas2 [Thermodesulfobacteriota bacterium]
MALYFLSYDLRKDKDYPRLTEELERFGAIKTLKSEWCFRHSDTSAAALRDHFKQYIDNDDGLMVAAVIDWAAYKLKDNPNKL